MGTIRKAIRLGADAIRLTKNMAEEIIDDLIKRGEVSGKDRTEMIERLLQDAKAQKDHLERKVIETVPKVMTDLGLPTKKDINKVLRRLENIEKAIGVAKGKREE
jgi:polyhydroxyalkanoate synthesis regulator phasin